MHLVSVLNRSVILALLWVVLTGGAVDSLPYGVATVVAATVLSMRLYPTDQPGIVAWRVAGFLPRFLAQGLLGGLDVARRAVDPRLPVAPGWVRVTLSNRHEAANVLLGGVISILPGTLSAGPGDGTMEIHVLHMQGFTPNEMQSEERRILGLFDRRIADQGEAHG